jgi:uncharacterized protein
MGLEFEWDPAKRRANIRNHGIDFLDARKIFDGPIVEEVDDREDYGEERCIAFGMAGLLVLCVVYTQRGHIIRLISARKADFDDEQTYFREIYGRGT